MTLSRVNAMVDRKTAAQMREEGMSYREIADVFGVSRQRIQQVLKKGIAYDRKYAADIEKIPYEGIYNYMVENPKVTFPALSMILFGTSNKNKNEVTRNFVFGMNCKIGKRCYDRLIEKTGMTYEQLFKLREGFKVEDNG